MTNDRTFHRFTPDHSGECLVCDEWADAHVEERLFMKPLEMPGAWVDDDGGLHIDLAILLEAAGFSDTPDNRATMMAVIRELATKNHATVIEVED